jgi:hypothetical protein
LALVPLVVLAFAGFSCDYPLAEYIDEFNAESNDVCKITWNNYCTIFNHFRLGDQSNIIGNQHYLRTACDNSRWFAYDSYAAKASFGIATGQYWRFIMIDRQELCARHCVRTLIEIVEQLPARWATRSPMPLDESTVGMLLLWTLIRWELRFPLTVLEEMGVDIWAFTQDIDELLEQEIIQKSGQNNSEASTGPDASNPPLLLRELTILWLDRAEDEARSMDNAYLGIEHLLLAMAAGIDSPLVQLFARYGIDHERLKNTVLQAVASKTPQLLDTAIDAMVVPLPSKDKYWAHYAVPWGASWDKMPAVGIPRKFSMAVLMMMVTLFAVLFSTLRMIGASPICYGLFGVLVFGVSMGQTILFGGKYPRAASIWTGAVLLPVEIGVINLLFHYINYYQNIFERILITFLFMMFAVPIGALFGYLAGGLSAGVVLVLEWKKTPEPLPTDDMDV